MKTLRLAQARKVPCTREWATIGAKFCPGQPPADVLAWLDDPVLVASTELPGVPSQTFELAVPPELCGREGVRLATTIVLPNGKHVAVLHVGRLVGTTLSVTVPMAALNSVAQWSVEPWTPEDELAAAQQRARRQTGPTRPLSPSLLELECPRIIPDELPERLRQGAECCGICSEALMATSGDARLPLRQLPCAHAFHVACVDPWLTTRERSCPLCRSVVLPSLPHAATRPSTPPDESSEAEMGTEGREEGATDGVGGFEGSGMHVGSDQPSGLMVMPHGFVVMAM